MKTYVQADGRVVRVTGRKPVRYLADGATLDPEQIPTPERPPPAPKKAKKDFIGDQYLVGANQARPGQGCLPDGRDEVCGDCVHFSLVTPYEGLCALYAARMTKLKGAPPRVPLNAMAGPDFRAKESD
jgi:hypothetical protein